MGFEGAWNPRWKIRTGKSALEIPRVSDFPNWPGIFKKIFK